MPQNESNYAPSDPHMSPELSLYHTLGTIPSESLAISPYDKLVLEIEETHNNPYPSPVDDNQETSTSPSGGDVTMCDARRATQKTVKSSLAEPVQEPPVSSDSGRSKALLPPKTRRHAPQGTAAVQTTRKYLTPGSVSSTTVINTNRPQVPDTSGGKVLSNLGLCDREKVTRRKRLGNKAKTVSGGVAKTPKGRKGTVVKT